MILAIPYDSHFFSNDTRVGDELTIDTSKSGTVRSDTGIGLS